MSLANLDMKRSATEFGAAIVVKLHPSPVLGETRAVPLQSIIGGRNGTDEGGKKIDGAVEGVEDRP